MSEARAGRTPDAALRHLPGYLALIGATTESAELNDAILAEQIRKMAPAFLRCPPVPDRPAGLPGEDNDVVRILRVLQGPGKHAQQDERIGKLAGRWRRAVMQCEELAARRLGQLLWALSAYDAVRALGTGDEYESERAELVDFVAAEYGEKAIEIEPEERRRVVSLIRHVQRIDVCSRALRQNEYAAAVKDDVEAMDAAEYGGDPGAT